MIAKTKITGIILAGGKSSRMGTDKGLLFFNEKMFIQHIIDSITPLVSEILIVSENTEYDQLGYKRVEDSIKNSGPIGGIHAGLSSSEREYNLILSCDVPLITSKLLKRLLTKENSVFDIVQFEANGNTIPLIALFKRQCLKKCQELLDQGEKRLRKLVLELRTKTISLPKEEHILVSNINTMKDLNEIKNGVNY
ncbi:molybdenum cofactor guanylyltransferase [Aquimarina sp. D1M17]|uniref:molybdenum cofactor guanylyltransferase n=1 Tax=Aquimarina acroporae TaxID=2937283 RepID=UPI0020BE2C9D|nr:molybdenum cofactor guanylyltransferase [Aquimarina acroporae]MCK8520973.1 molybdenum cofactor guanylyltransferase [Aquimarina acroporae]